VLAYANFISGPPGGKTLPLNPTRLSDLAGGVYGMGASVASTGHLAKRPAIKAANSLAGGENFDDVLQYYQVSRSVSESKDSWGRR
jgi:SEL1 protein